MDFRKVNCAYHSTQQITNFCSEKECMLPLCPTCISSHTQLHIQKSNHPKFQSIGQCLKRAEQTIDSQSLQFYNCKSRLLDLVSKKQNFSKEIVNRLIETKRIVLKQIQTLFQELIKESLNTLRSKEKLGQLYDIVNRQFNSLNETKLQLRAENFLPSLIGYFSKQVDSKADFLKDVVKQVKFNEQYQAEIETDPTVLKDIQSFIRKGIKLKFVLPTPEITISPNKRQPSPQPSSQQIVKIQPNFDHKIQYNPVQFRHPIMMRQNSPQQFPFRRSVDEFQNRKSIDNFNPLLSTGGFFQPNSVIQRPLSSQSKHSNIPTSQSLLIKSGISRQSPNKLGQQILSQNSKISQNKSKIKQKKGLTLHKTINQITFR